MGVAAITIGTVILFIYLQEIGLKLRREEQRAWWAGTGRDLLNAAGFGAIAWVLTLSGFPLPAALLVGGTVTLIVFGAYVFMVTQTHSNWPRVWTLLVGLLVALSVLFWPERIISVAADLMGLFTGSAER